MRVLNTCKHYHKTFVIEIKFIDNHQSTLVFEKAMHFLFERLYRITFGKKKIIPTHVVNEHIKLILIYVKIYNEKCYQFLMRKKDSIFLHNYRLRCNKMTFNRKHS